MQVLQSLLKAGYFNEHLTTQNLTTALIQIYVILQCENLIKFAHSNHGVHLRLLFVRLVFCHQSLPCQTQLNHCNTQKHYGFHPQSLTESIRFATLSHSLRSFNVMQRVTFYRQSKAKIDGLLVTHYYKKALEAFQGFCIFNTIQVLGNQSYAYKTVSKAIQHGISFCVALQCVINRRTFQGNHVLYHRGTVANHLQSGRISPVGNRVWWVLDWVW